MDTESVLLELLGETETPLAQAEAEQVRASEKVERLKAERYGLQLALARHRGEPEPARPTSAAAVDAGTVRHPTPEAFAWRALNRSDAVERVVTEAGRPMNRNDIVARLTEAGREGDNPENISATLAHLHRAKRLTKFGKAQWTVPMIPQPVALSSVSDTQEVHAS